MKRRKGGGVGLFIKNNIPFCIIDRLTFDVENNFECTTVKLILKQDITVSSIHRQPNSRIIDLTNSIDNLFTMQYGVLYLCVHLNINLLEHSLLNNTQNFHDHLFTISLFPLINKPT